MDIKLSSDQVVFLGQLLERELDGWVRAEAATDWKAQAQHYQAMISNLIAQLLGDDLELEEVGK